MTVEELRFKLREYLRVVEKSQEQLAFELGLDPATLSSKLNQKRGKLSDREKKEIVTILIRWKSLKNTAQVVQLLAILGESPDFFSPQEWDNLALTTMLTSPVRTLVLEQALAVPYQHDLSEAPQILQFYGREQELQQITDWILKERCRLVTLLGLGGLGKTSLAGKLVERFGPQFEFVKWCSLRDAPPLEEVLDRCLSFFAGQSLEIPHGLEAKINLLLSQFRNSRCLLILDNLEALMSGGEQVGKYLPEYRAYRHFFQRLCESAHQSCVILTSREKPAELLAYEDEQGPVRSYLLPGLDETSSLKILDYSGLKGTQGASLQLIYTYSNNPLKLKLVASYIRSLFGSDIDRFLEEGQTIFGDITDLLRQQFERLSYLEKIVIYWLALEREPVSLTELEKDLNLEASKARIFEALLHLEKRSLLEIGKNNTLFTLQSVVMEYASLRLLNHFSQEILGTKPFRLLLTHALLKAEGKDYLRESQSRLFIDKLIQKLLVNLKSPQAVEAKILSCLAELKLKPLAEQGYAPGNLINCLSKLRGNLSGLDFSGLNMKQVYLQGVALQNTSFHHSHFSATKFSRVFGSVLSIAFSPSGEMLAVSDVQGKIRLWDLRNDQLYQTLIGHSDRVRAISFNSDGSLLSSGGDDFTVRIWSVKSGECLHTISGHTDRVWSVAFSPDGNSVASSANDRCIKIWQPGNGQLLASLEGQNSTVLSLAFSPDGSTLAGINQDTSISVWQSLNWQWVGRLTGHSGEVTSISFSSNSEFLASGSTDQSVKLWQINNLKCIKTINEFSSTVWAVAFGPSDNSLAVGVQQQGVILWDIAGSRPLRNIGSNQLNQAWQLALSADGSVMATGYENQTVKLWDSATGQCIKTLHSHFNRIGAVAFNPNGTLLASGGEDSFIRIWDTQSWNCIAVLEGHTNRVWSVAFNTEGTLLVSGSQDQTIRVWEVGSWQTLRVIEDQGTRVWAVTLHPAAKIVASCGDSSNIKLWDVETSILLRQLKGHTDRVRTIAFSPDGYLLASGAEDNSIKLWDCNSSECLRTLQGHQSWVRSVAFSPTGKLLSSGSEDRTVKLWDLDSGKCINTLVGHQGRIWSVSFNPTGDLLTSSSQDYTIRLWQVASGECLQVLTGHTGLVRIIIFSPDNKFLASGSEDETIKLWDLNSGMCLQTLRSPRLYENMNLANTTGLSRAFIDDLKTLGAVEKPLE